MEDLSFKDALIRWYARKIAEETHNRLVREGRLLSRRTVTFSILRTLTGMWCAITGPKPELVDDSGWGL